jgi:hypothetical protein
VLTRSAKAYLNFVVKQTNPEGSKLAERVGFALVDRSHGLNRWRFVR